MICNCACHDCLYVLLYYLGNFRDAFIAYVSGIYFGRFTLLKKVPLRASKIPQRQLKYSDVPMNVGELGEILVF